MASFLGCYIWDRIRPEVGMVTEDFCAPLSQLTSIVTDATEKVSSLPFPSVGSEIMGFYMSSDDSINYEHSHDLQHHHVPRNST